MFVAVPPGRDEHPVRVFPTFTEDLNQLADWLVPCGVTTVAMESTGGYWRLRCINVRTSSDNGRMRRRPPRNPLFSRRRFEDNLIIRCVRWYLRFKLSYRDLAEIAWELGVSVAVVRKNSVRAPHRRLGGLFDQVILVM